MELNKYQEWTNTTAIFPKEKALEYLALGLVSEAGEVAGKVKKLIRDGKIDTNDLIAELGDVFWYLAQLCEHCHIKAEYVLKLNHNKL